MKEITYLSLGAGVKSGTLAEMMVQGDLAKADFAIFADTQDEPQHTYSYLEYLTQRLARVGVPVFKVTAGSIVDSITTSVGRFASIPAYVRKPDGTIGQLRRQCTKEYKIQPIENHARKVLQTKSLAYTTKRDQIRVKSGVHVTQLLGISRDEIHRAREDKRRWIDPQYPLLDYRMSRWDCVQYLRANGLPVPKRSSCRVCPYKTTAQWVKMAEQTPDDWAHVVAIDHQMRHGNSRYSDPDCVSGPVYLHWQCFPLPELLPQYKERPRVPALFDLAAYTMP